MQLSLRFSHGVLPSELRLCEMLGVSRTAMREAIRGLIAKGLIDSRPRVGTRVRDPEYWNHLDPDVLRWRLEVAASICRRAWSRRPNACWC